ncbi:MAG: hypothetical protein JNM33_17925 [Rubrivivax sp.]|nr:hypothetical protein [Rubrivivax sp.]
MQPVDTEAREAAAWAAFLQQLTGHLAAQWPLMQERLGDRMPAFVELCAQQTLQRGFVRAASVARMANLWCVWGPGFHDKPGFEWAAELLKRDSDAEWLTLHQLLQRSLKALAQLPDTRIAPATLVAADQRLIETFGRLGRHGELHPREPEPLPARACDLEAVELRLLEPAVAEQYVFAAGQWQRATLPVPAPVRVDIDHPVPRLIAVLGDVPEAKPATRVQLRSRAHAQCDDREHPALRFAGTHGQWLWVGHETRAVSWPVSALRQPLPPAGAGTAIAEETSPDIFKLELATCGLRDDGEAIGPLATQLWVWPAAQWLLTLERTAAEAQPVLPGRDAVARGATRCTVERDGTAQDAAPLRAGFDQGLDAAAWRAQQSLLAALAAAPGMAPPRLDGALSLLTGRAAITWGWALGPQGMNARAFLRTLGALEMQACAVDLHTESELTVGEGRARLRLHCSGREALAVQWQRDSAEPLLTAALMPAKASFRIPFTAEVLPLAGDAGTLLQAAGPCSGALVGEAGLRPRLSGGSGWCWYAQLRLEPAALPLALVDPLLGRREVVLPLWGAQALLDWSLG